MANRFTQAAEKARQITNDQLANEITSICSLNMAKVNELMPAQKDKEAFLALMKEVQSDTTADQKLAYFQKNFASVGSVALKVLGAVV